MESVERLIEAHGGTPEFWAECRAKAIQLLRDARAKYEQEHGLEPGTLEGNWLKMRERKCR